MKYLEQENEAKRFINKYGKSWMLYDDEAIGEIISTAMNARLKYNPDNEKKTQLSTYLIKSVKRKMQRLNHKRFKSMMVEIRESVPTKDNNSPLLDFVKNTNTLTSREKQIIEFYYYDNYTLQEIGERFNVTRERIRQCLQETLTKLKGYKDVLAEK